MVNRDRVPGVALRIETDVCVVGAGPAGITFTREWIGRRARVALIESGGFADDPAVQDLGSGPTISRHLSPGAIAHGRHRQFGGTSNLWIYNTVPNDGHPYARSLPLEAIDLERRDAVPHSGWPLSLSELAPYYARAQASWNGAPFDYRPGRWGASAPPPLVFTDGTVITRMVQHGPRDVFTLRYRDELLAAGNVTLHLGCTVVALEGDDSGDTIRRARVLQSDGSEVEVFAQVFVLAGGGIENARLLLASEPTRPGGPGNRHDVVGRFVTDHPEFRMGTLEPGRREVFGELGLYDMRWVERFLVAGMLTLSEDVKRHDGLLNMSVALVPKPAGFGGPAHRSLSTLLALGRREWPAGAAGHVRTLLRSPLETAASVATWNWPYYELTGGWSRSGPHRNRFRVLEVYAAAEQSPDPENRITLDSRQDQLGRPRPTLRWNWSALDQENLERSIARFLVAFEAVGLGRLRRWVEFEGAGRPRFPGIHHPMGGTRMHEDPREGVVDEHGSVHGIANLFIAGSSVFPTGNGYANPTLTLLALTIRLADHVKTVLGEIEPRATVEAP
jgi:choline dehydrogenase-like flavoprotein